MILWTWSPCGERIFIGFKHPSPRPPQKHGGPPGGGYLATASCSVFQQKERKRSAGASSKLKWLVTGREPQGSTIQAKERVHHLCNDHRVTDEVSVDCPFGKVSELLSQQRNDLLPSWVLVRTCFRVNLQHDIKVHRHCAQRSCILLANDIKQRQGAMIGPLKAPMNLRLGYENM